MLVGCLTSQQHASVSQGRICSDNFTCCHTEIEVADPTFYLTQSQYTDTGPTSPSADPITPGAWQGSHWSANFLSHWYDSTPTNLEVDAFFCVPDHARSSVRRVRRSPQSAAVSQPVPNASCGPPPDWAMSGVSKRRR